METFDNKVCVITGAGSGFGLEFARRAAALQMRLVLADIDAVALEAAATELSGLGVQVLAERVDVRDAGQVQRLADLSFERFGAVHLLFNNAGVATGGYVWEHSPADWEWVLGVNLLGVAHGIRSFVPRMIAQRDDSHVVNTASVAGFISPQMMGLYNVSKQGVVALSETLCHDLRVAGATLGVSMLCPAFVATGINRSERSRPAALIDSRAPTESMELARRALDQAVSAGRIDARAVASMAFDAVRTRRFYVFTHPKIMGSISLRMQDIIEQRNPSDPFSARPELAPK